MMSFPAYTLKHFIRVTALSLAALYLYQPCIAQEQNITGDEKVLREYLSQKKCTIDSTANAVVLYEKGISYISDGMLHRSIERVVKIIGNDAVRDFATISIGKGDYASVTKIKGATYNLENGLIDKQEIHRSDVLKDEVDKTTTVFKFNLPSVKEGSVIHYSYTINSPGWIFVPDWTFQNEYPTLESGYEINVPSYINYTAIERVNVAMPKVNKQKEMAGMPDCSYQETIGDQINHLWIRRNVPAFKKEPYMGSSDNFTERVKIHIESFRGSLYNVGILPNWTSISKKWYYENDKSCGQVFSNNHFLKEKVKELTRQKTTELEKARAIFAFVRDSIRAKQSMSGNTASGMIKEVYNKREGSVQGVNLLLTAMLRSANLLSEPVLLGTRSNEHLNSIFPDPDNIDYLISKLSVNGKNYFLDASVKQMPFGILPPECYNGYCRVVNEKGGDAYLDPDSLLNKTTIIVVITPSDKDSSKLLLKVDEQFGAITALEYRKDWQEDSSAATKMVRKNILHSTLPTTLTKCSVGNIDNPDLPLSLHYEATIDFAHGAETIYLDPFFSKFYNKNPFAATERKYAVEMDYVEDINYILHLRLPEGYEIDDYPASTAFQLGDKKLISMKNIFSYEKEQKSMALSSRFVSNTTVFYPGIYEQLRAFYEKVIEEQNKKIVIKKSHI